MRRFGAAPLALDEMIMERLSARRIEAVIKVTERCNINCTYCYVFNKGNDDFESRPVYLKNETIQMIVSYLKAGAADLSASEVSVVFHGGEPLMLKRAAFDQFCSELKAALEPDIKVILGVQTNAILVTDTWIDLFEKHKVHVGVSIDGDRIAHDMHRIDHRGRGTYDRVVAGVRKLQRAAHEGRIGWPGAICVINPNVDGGAIYRHFVDDLGFRGLSFHLPMDTYETYASGPVERFSDFVNGVFDQWVADDNPKIYVRMFDQLLRFFHGKESAINVETKRLRLQHVTISTDGTVGVDELKPAPLKQDMWDVRTSTLYDFADSEFSRYVRDVYRSLPGGCRDCIWKNYCGGGIQHGVQVNRWSDASGFDNSSLLCNALQSIYSHVARYAVSTGLPMHTLEQVLSDERVDFLDAADVAIPEAYMLKANALHKGLVE